MDLADDGTVRASANTPALAADFIARNCEIAAPPSFDTPAAARILTLFRNLEARAAFTVPKSRLTRRSLLVGACASVVIALGSTLLTFRPLTTSVSSAPTAQVATIRPPEIWSVFDPQLQPVYRAIDQWIVDRYIVGAYGEIVGVLQSIMASPGNTEAKNLASIYICRAERWELSRLLLVGLDPAISSPSARHNILVATRRAVKYTGIQHFSASEKAFLQSYLALAVETDPSCIDQAQKAIQMMTTLGL